MRFAQIFCVFASVTALVESAPYLPRDAKLQRSRRRAVDYPPLPYHVPLEQKEQIGPRHAKRTVPYSVVPVDGGSTTTVQRTASTVSTAVKTSSTTVSIVVTKSASPAAPVTQTQTQTQTQIQMETQTVVHTKIHTKVNTRVVTETKKKPAQTVHKNVVITTTEIEISSTATPTIVKTKAVTTKVKKITKTVGASATKTVVLSPSPTKTVNYDNGQWHPPYPKTTLMTMIRNSTAKVLSSPTTETSTIETSDAAASPSPAYHYDYRYYGSQYNNGGGSYGKRALDKRSQ